MSLGKLSWIHIFCVCAFLNQIRQCTAYGVQFTGNINQQWEMTAVGTDSKGIVVQIRSIRSEHCLDNRGGLDDNENPIQQSTCADVVNQKFVVVPKDGYFELVNYSTRKCVTVRYGALTDGGVIDQYDCINGNNQLWMYKEGKLINKHSQKCIDVPNGTLQRYTIMEQYTCN